MVASQTTRKDRDWFRGKVTNQGGPDHLKGVLRLLEVFEREDFTCKRGEKFWAFTLKGEVPYEPDVLVERGYIQAVLEVDGKEHGSRVHIAKDAHRDDWFKNDENGPHVPTVRYWTWELVGRQKLSNREIMEKFYYEVNN